MKTGSLSNARGAQLIDVPAGNTRFVRLTIGSAQSGRRDSRSRRNATIATNAQGQVVMTRRFANCTLTLNTATKEVSPVTAAPAASAAPSVAAPATPLRRRPLAEQVLGG